MNQLKVNQYKRGQELRVAQDRASRLIKAIVVEPILTSFMK